VAGGVQVVVHVEVVGVVGAEAPVVGVLGRLEHAQRRVQVPGLEVRVEDQSVSRKEPGEGILILANFITTQRKYEIVGVVNDEGDTKSEGSLRLR
jgi:hypothetical protein